MYHYHGCARDLGLSLRRSILKAVGSVGTGKVVWGVTLITFNISTRTFACFVLPPVVWTSVGLKWNLAAGRLSRCSTASSSSVGCWTIGILVRGLVSLVGSVHRGRCCQWQGCRWCRPTLVCPPLGRWFTATYSP